MKKGGGSEGRRGRADEEEEGEKERGRKEEEGVGQMAEVMPG